MDKPLVSILIPAYNVEKYISQCLDSVINQTYRNLQIVIVDDGSKDMTGKICDEYAAKDDRVEVYHIPNGGVANARNLLLSKIKGDYFLFVDSDDWIEQDMTEILVGALESNKVDISVCSYVAERNGAISEIIKTGESAEIFEKNKAIELFLYHRRLNGSLWNKLIKTTIVSGVAFEPNVSYGEDALFIWECLKKVQSIIIIKSQLYHYRVNNQSISHQKFGAKKLSGHIVWRKFVDDTVYNRSEFHDIAKANCAVSDFWLLLFAAIDNYPEDENIGLFRKNLGSQIKSIHKLKLLSTSKILVAYCLIFNYRLTKSMLRVLKRYLL